MHVMKSILSIAVVLLCSFTTVSLKISHANPTRVASTPAIGAFLLSIRGVANSNLIINATEYTHLNTSFQEIWEFDGTTPRLVVSGYGGIGVTSFESNLVYCYVIYNYNGCNYYEYDGTNTTHLGFASSTHTGLPPGKADVIHQDRAYSS